ncbi:hypothetical protein H4R24_003397 [Coemansia sp. RSA 988]|nr:hypothetical protein H4R24_003397 [Coemansia sp. RSA 988]
MADYILVTLQNDMSVNELKAHCRTDLTEFFGDKTNVFVDTLFDALAKKQYLPREEKTSTPAATAPPATSTGTSGASLNIKGSGSRVHNGSSHSTRDGASSGDRNGGSSRRRSRSPTLDRNRFDRRLQDNRSSSRERRVQREQRFPQQQMSGMTLMDGPLEPERESGFQQQPQQTQQLRRRKPCFEFMRKGACQRGDQCTYAHTTIEQAQMMGMQVPMNMMGNAFGRPNGQFMMRPGIMGPGAQNPAMFGGMRPQMTQGQQQQQQQQRAPGGSGRDAQNYSTTAVFVVNIPNEHLNEASLRDFFGRFGAIKDVRIDTVKHNATVEFSDNNAQAQALNTPEAVFNNRFVRVYAAFSNASEAATSDVNNGNVPHENPSQPPPVWKPKSAAIKKAELIEKYVEQQKELMRKLTSTQDMPPATRKIIMDSIKQIQSKIDEIRLPKSSAITHESVVSQSEATSSDPAEHASEDASSQQQRSAVASEKAALQSKLSALQEEAARLGMAARGRGRGRGGASRGGWTNRGAMSLDKRPRALVLSNVGQEAAEMLSSEMAQFGEIEHVDKAEDHTGPPFTYTVKYKARWEAENALKAIATLDLFANVGVAWDQ